MSGVGRNHCCKSLRPRQKQPSNSFQRRHSNTHTSNPSVHNPLLVRLGPEVVAVGGGPTGPAPPRNPPTRFLGFGGARAAWTLKSTVCTTAASLPDPETSVDLIFQRRHGNTHQQPRRPYDSDGLPYRLRRQERTHPSPPKLWCRQGPLGPTQVDEFPPVA